MDVVLYTGTGAALTPTSSLGFNPDWIWIKSRSAATDHALYDIVRGAQARLESNTTDAEVTTDDGVTAFNSAGFTLGTLAQVNTSSATYAAWCWDAGTSTVTNTAGSITSQVRANPSAGFSVVTWTGNGASSATVGHGLGVAPVFYVSKNRSASGNWQVLTTAINGSMQYGFLNLTDGFAAAGQTAPTSTVLNLLLGGNETNNGNNFVAYCFAPVSGYSSFGSYTGNGSADGPFVYTGFRPRWILQKSTASETYGSWHIYDTARDTYNPVDLELYPNLSSVEGTIPGGDFDILSNGFKIRTNFSGGWNTNGISYIYAAFAESPLQFARAR
jgi:hypothetical protein